MFSIKLQTLIHFCNKARADNKDTKSQLKTGKTLRRSVCSAYIANVQMTTSFDENTALKF